MAGVQDMFRPVVQDTGVNLEEEESRMMARAERSGTANFGVPVPADAPCMNEQPFRQKVLPSPPQTPALSTIHPLMHHVGCRNDKQPCTDPEMTQHLPITAHSTGHGRHTNVHHTT